jgi:7-cyano-7-deazaguanine synthase in queuosine biosynthesis
MIEKIVINGIEIDLYEGHIGIMHSGGADSAILLYILMSKLKSTINVYTCSNKIKGRSNSKTALEVIGKCIDLTQNNNIVHHSYFVEEQTFTALFDGSNKFLKDLDIMYTGATSLPPDKDLEYFSNPCPLYDKRNPNIERNTHVGKYYAPFFNINKKNIASLYNALDVTDKLFPHTRSCEDLIQLSGHCNKCWWCEERKWAFGKT